MLSENNQFSLRDIRKLATEQAGNFGLRQAHTAPRFRLRQTQSAHGLSDFNNEAGFDFQFIGIR